jgi:hypothetical protein
MRILRSALTVVLAAITPLAHADVSNLEEGFPTALTDAYPIAYLGREAQLVNRFVRTHEDEDGFMFEPRLEFGFPRNTQISVAVPFQAGELEPDGIEDVRVEALYNFNQESLAIPAVSAIAGLEAPTGDDSHGVDPIVGAVMMKTLGRSPLMHRLHVIGRYQFNAEDQESERDGRYEAVIGYSRRVSPQLFVVFDYLREQELEQDREVNLVEAGLRYGLTPTWVLSAGAGFGIGAESPEVQATIGLQKELLIPYLSPE